MKELDKVLFLKQSPLFDGLPLDILLPIAEKMGEKEMSQGDKVFRYGDAAPLAVYLIQAGQVELRSGEGELFGVLKEGEFFGEEAILAETARGYEATCTLPTTLLCLTKNQFTQILSDCPQITLTFLTAYAKGHPYRKRL